MSLYWGGSNVTSPVRPLEVPTFKDLVDRHINVPVQIPISRGDFFSRSRDEQNVIKNVPHITGCSFKHGTTHRCDANADQHVIAMFDIDNSDDARAFLEAPEVLAELLYPYNFVVYLTASSTPENPRIRIMVELVPCDPQHRKRIIRFLARRIGLPDDFSGIRESTVISQPMFRPVVFLGEDKAPVLCSRTNGQALDVADIPQQAEPEPGSQEEMDFTFSGDFGDDFGLAYLPVAGLTVDDVQPAMKFLDPDMGFKGWSTIFACLRHQFRQPDEARDAFNMAKTWSTGSDKFKPGECELKWRSFTPDPKGKAPVTIRSLFKMAMDGGWDNKPLSEKVQQTVEEWMATVTDPQELLVEGCKRIQAMPFRNAVMEDYLVAKMQKAIKALGGVTVDRAAIKRELANVKYAKKVEAQGDDKPDWLRPFVYVGKINAFCNTITTGQLSPEAFDNMFSVNLISADAESESAKSGRPAVLPRHFALNQMNIDRVHDTIYCPLKGSEAEPIITFEGQQYLNTYRPGTAPLMDEARSEEAGELFLLHMGIVIEDEVERNHVVDFFCYNVQHPGEKVPWVVFINSAEGVGKGFLARMMGAVLGTSNVQTVGPQALVKEWNDWQIGTIFSILDEIHIPGHMREAVMNSLKIAISDPIVSINKRNTHAFQAPNYTNYVAFSNHEDALFLKPTDRRWNCNKSPIQTDEQVMELVEAGHFTKVEPLFGELAGALRHWMMNRKISDTFPRFGPAPKTKYREALIDNAKNKLLEAIERLIADPSETMICDDIIHLPTLEGLTEFLARNNAKASHYVRTLGYERWNRSDYYVHRKRYIKELGNPDEVLKARNIEKDL